MKIGVPRINDYEDINNLAKQVHNLHVKWRPDLFNKVEEVITKEELKDLIENKEIYIAKIDEKIVGYIIIEIIEKQNQSPKIRHKKYLEIDVLCVDKDNRRKGIGSELLAFAKDKAIENKCTDIYLTVNEENTSAIKLYEKFGLRVKNIAYSMQINK